MKNSHFWLWIFPAFLLGTWLRLYMISDQILLNDEWHAMNIVVNTSWAELFIKGNRRANSIPLNLYSYFLLYIERWSELLFRLPSIVAGLSLLYLFPFLIKKLINARLALVFTYLIAISPTLILYSRISRAYSIISLSASLSFFFIILWAETGLSRYIRLYFITGLISVYFHLTPVITVFTPPLCLFILKFYQRKTRRFQAALHIVPSISDIIVVIFILSALTAAIVLPPFFKAPWTIGIWLEADSANIETLFGFASKFSGTSNIILCVSFWSLFAFGQVLFMRQRPLIGITMLVIYLLYFLCLFSARWESMNSSLQFTRFCITFLPMTLVVVTKGLEGIINVTNTIPFLSDRKKFLIQIFIPALFIGTLFSFSPFFHIYQFPNNFTNHAAFNESFKTPDWKRSYNSEVFHGYNMKKDQISGFYFNLANQNNSTAIVEYPMFIGDHFNLYYFYQHYHGKKIIAGYIPTLKVREFFFGDFLYGDMYTDYILSRVGKKEAYRFRNMVDMLDVDTLKSSGATFVVLHKNLYNEMFSHLKDENPHHQMPYRPVFHLNQIYLEEFGPPSYEDNHITVFKIK